MKRILPQNKFKGSPLPRVFFLTKHIRLHFWETRGHSLSPTFTIPHFSDSLPCSQNHSSHLAPWADSRKRTKDTVFWAKSVPYLNMVRHGNSMKPKMLFKPHRGRTITGHSRWEDETPLWVIFRNDFEDEFERSQYFFIPQTQTKNGMNSGSKTTWDESNRSINLQLMARWLRLVFFSSWSVALKLKSKSQPTSGHSSGDLNPHGWFGH